MKIQTSREFEPAIARGGVACPFPWRVHDMLATAEREGLDTIVSWQPHGRAFTVKKPSEFVDKILPRFFSQTKYPSFQRQLNIYGFSRFAHGQDKGAYYHKCFVRGNRPLVRGMIRRKVKGTKFRRTMSPSEEPDFYNYPDGDNDSSRKENVATPMTVTSSNDMVAKPIKKSKTSKEGSPVTTLLPSFIIPEDLLRPELATVDFSADFSLLNNNRDGNDSELLSNFDFLANDPLFTTVSTSSTWNHTSTGGSAGKNSWPMFAI